MRSLLFSWVVVWIMLPVPIAEAEDFPKGCTDPEVHSNQEKPHTQINQGDLQCHAARGAEGDCPEGFDGIDGEGDMNCNTSNHVGWEVTHCTVTLHCDSGLSKTCLAAVGSAGGNLSALIGKNSDGEVYGHCKDPNSDESLTCP